jgi:exosome complex RNA-binding protein Rrp4
MIHKSNFAPIETFEKLEIGETMEVFFLGSNNKEQLLFGDNNVSKEWLNGEVEKLVGEILPVRIIKTNDGKTDYIVNEKYNATLATINSIYPTNRKIIKSAIKNFKNGDLIHCEISKVNKLNKTLQLKWDFAHEIEGIISRMTIEESKPKNQIKEFRNRSNPVENIADTNVIEKLDLIGKTVKVAVIKKEDNFGRISNKYKIENKYSGKLILSNDNYKISAKEKKQIEKNLQDGEILDCQVLSVDKNQISINWKLMDEELLRFIKE